MISSWRCKLTQFRQMGISFLLLSPRFFFDFFIYLLLFLVMMMMIAFITFQSSLVPLFEGLWSSNSWEFELSDFRRNRTDDLGPDSPSLWPTEPRLHVRSEPCRVRQWLEVRRFRMLRCQTVWVFLLHTPSSFCKKVYCFWFDHFTESDSSSSPPSSSFPAFHPLHFLIISFRDTVIQPGVWCQSTVMVSIDVTIQRVRVFLLLFLLFMSSLPHSLWFFLASL